MTMNKDNIEEGKIGGKKDGKRWKGEKKGWKVERIERFEG